MILTSLQIASNLLFCCNVHAIGKYPVRISTGLLVLRYWRPMWGAAGRHNPNNDASFLAPILATATFSLKHDAQVCCCNASGG